ncbi:protein kinase domain-containing protein [Nonomuraea jabiensis]|uniref:protein kinase domain-containing protein n=1 Tax=Nonomuraea jabiensis TaxID=882448 RepID=UPI0036ABF215
MNHRETAHDVSLTILGPEGPVVIDFGISRALDHAVTQTGAFGTPGYMAPEQVSGGEVGPAADVFSWAATMVFAATGRRAFAGESVPAVLHALLYDPPDLSGVPASLRSLVTTCLDKDPARRLTADDLVRALTGDDALTMPDASPPDFEDAPPRRVPRRAVPAVGVAAAAAAVAVAMWPRERDPVRPAAPALRFGAELGKPLTGHTNDVRAVSLGTLDGVPVTLTGSDDETARLWNLRTSRQIGRPLAGHTEWVRSVVLDQLDGAPIAITAGDDGTVRVWDLAARKQLGRPLTGHSGWVRSVALGFLNGTPVVVTGGQDMTARVWDLIAWKQLGTPLTGHTGVVWSVAMGNLDGTPVAVTGSEDRTVRVWDLNTRKPLGAPFTGHSDCVWSVAVGLLDGRPVAVSGSRDQTARTWNLAPAR